MTNALAYYGAASATMEKSFVTISVSASLQVSTVVPAATLVNWKRTDLLVFKTIPKIYFLYSFFVTKKPFFFFEKI